MMTMVSVMLFLLVPLSSLLAQDDLSRLSGEFIRCEQVQLLGLYSQHVRSSSFKCPRAAGFVMNETPVKKIRFTGKCPGQNPFPVMEAATIPECNTIGQLESTEGLEKIALSTRPNLFAGTDKTKCHFEIISADLFEFYPIFSSAGPKINEPFLETMEYNTEADPDYRSRINGGLTQGESIKPEISVGAVQIDHFTNKDLQKKICELPSLATLELKVQNEYLKIIIGMYQNPAPELKDDKIQRKLFCLLKNYYESSEDYDNLLNLIAKMKFKQEKCAP